MALKPPKSDGSNLRSKKENERLAAIKAKAPTNVSKAKAAASKFSSGYSGIKAVGVTSTQKPYKWYSGSQPTAREVVARIYNVTDNKTKQDELLGAFAANTQDRGHVLYNPYAQASNSKAIDGLRGLGIEVPDVITDKWVDDMWGQYGQYARETTSSYGPSAPTTKSTRENDIAYWVGTLVEDKEKTNLAEAQVKDLYSEVAYYVNLGYSDDEVMKRVREDFGSKYNVLEDMDEKRMVGDAVRLNRAIDYSGDDTIYGMMWAARNGGGTGNYFDDAINYTMGNGNLYVPDPNSEATRDPSSYESFDPYAGGSTLHEVNMRTNQTRYDQAWLDENRADMMATEQGRKDFEAIQKGVTNDIKINQELAELTAWVQKKIDRGADPEELKKTVKDMLDKNSATYDSKYSTLANAEYARFCGSYIDTAGNSDFTLPNFYRSIDQMAEARAEEQAAASSKKEGSYEQAGNWLARLFGGGKDETQQAEPEGQPPVQGGGGQMGANAQGAGRATAAPEEAKAEAAPEEEPIQQPRAIDIPKKPEDPFEMPVAQDAPIGEQPVAVDTPKAPEDPFDMPVAQDTPIGEQPVAVDTPKGEEKPKSNAAEFTKRMIEGIVAADQAQAEPAERQIVISGAKGSVAYDSVLDDRDLSDPEAGKYWEMTNGGQWDNNAFEWALANSTNSAGLYAEFKQGINDIRAGRVSADEAGLAGSWWKAHGGLLWQEGSLIHNKVGKVIDIVGTEDTRRVYGERVYEALMANEEANASGAIDDDQYVENLLMITGVTDTIQEANEFNGGDEEAMGAAADEMFSLAPQAAAPLDTVMKTCADGTAQLEASREAAQQELYDVTRMVIGDYHSGKIMSPEENEFMQGVMMLDITEQAKGDQTYQDMLAYIGTDAGKGNKDAVAQLVANAPVGIEAGDTGVIGVASMSGTIVKQQYVKGVNATAQAKLERDMQMAMACGYTLEEYYAAFPEEAKTGESLLKEAEEEYTTSYKGFGNTFAAMLQATDVAINGERPKEETEAKPKEPWKLVKEVGSGETATGMTLTDMFGLAVDQSMASGKQSLAKAAKFLLYDGLNNDEVQQTLRTQYGNDPAAYRADVEAYAASLPEDSAVRKDLEMRLKVYENDVFDIGVAIPEAKLAQVMENQQRNLEAIQDVVDEYGTPANKFAYKVISTSVDSARLMYETMAMTAAGMPGLGASIAAAAPSGFSSAADIYEQTGNYDASLGAGLAITVISGALEHWMNVNYISKRGQRSLDDMAAIARGNLAKGGLVNAAAQSPSKVRSMAELGLVYLANGVANNVGEGTQEFTQAGAEALITNLTNVLCGTGDQLFTLKDFLNSLEAGAMGAVASVPLSMVGGAVGDATGASGGTVATNAQAQQMMQGAMGDMSSAEVQAQPRTTDAMGGFTPGMQPYINRNGQIGTQEEAEAAPERAGETINAAIEQVINQNVIRAAATELGNIDTQAVEAAEQAYNEAYAVFEEEDNNRAAAYAEYDHANGELTRARDNLRDINDRINNSGDVDPLWGKVYFSEDERNAMSQAAQSVDEWTEKLKSAEEKLGDTEDGYNKAVDSLDKAEAALDSARAAVQEVYDGILDTVAQQNSVREFAEQAILGNMSPENKAAMMDYLGKVNEFSSAKMDLYNAKNALMAAERNGASASEKGELRKAVANAEARVDSMQEGLEAAMETLNDKLASDTGAAEIVEGNSPTQTDAFMEADNIADDQQYDDLRDVIGAEELARSARERYAKYATAEYASTWKSTAYIQEMLTELEAAEKTAADKRAAYNAKYTTQGRYQAATQNMQQFTADDMTNPESPNYEAAQEAYDDMQDAKADADYEAAQTALDEATANMDAGNPESVQAFEEARTRAAESAENRAATKKNTEARRAKRTNGNKVRFRKDVSGANARKGADGWADHRTDARTGEQTKADKNPIEIMRDLTASIKVGYSPNGPMNVKGSRVSQDVMAFYNDKTKGIRIRGQYAGDLDTGLHEFGHAVQQRLGALKATPDMVAALPAEVRKEYSAAELDGEAVAEFVVEYMYGRAGAVRAAGEEYVQAFEEMLRKDPVLNAAMARGRDQATLWANADAASRLAASVKDTDTAQQRDKPQYKGIKDRLDALRTQVVDSKLPLKKIGDKVYAMKKWEMSAKERASVLLNRDFVDLEGNYMAPSVAQQLEDTGWTYSKQNEEDLNTYLLAQLGLDRMKQKKPLSGQTAGYTKADWRGIMKDIAKRNPTIPKAAKVWVNVWQDFVDGWLVPNGQMTAETRDQLREMYPHYVPTKRVVDVDWSKGGKISGDAFKLRGLKEVPSDLEFINPVQQIVQMIDSGVRAVSYNQVLQALDKEIQKDPEGLEWLIKQVPAGMAVDKNDVDPIKEALNAALKNADGVDPEAINKAFDLLGDMEEQWKTLTRSSLPNVVSGRRSDGTAFYYQVEQKNRDLFEAIVGSEPMTNKFLQTVKRVTNGFSRLATQLSPTFSISNFFADSPTSIATGTWAATPLDAVGKQIVGLIELIRKTPDARAFYAMGGGMQDRYNMNEGKGIQKFREDVLGQKTFKSRAKNIGLQVVTLGTTNLTELLEVLNRYVEVRFGDHDLSTFEGRVKAMNAQQDVTVDFGTSGSSQILRGALAFIPFGNAAIQGLDKTVRMFEGLGSKDPEVRSRSGKAIVKTVTCSAIYAAAQAYALGALKELFFGGDDDEDERKREQYELISDEMKAGNLMIPINSNVFDQERLWIRIPMTRDVFGKAMFSMFMDGFSDLTNMDELHIDAWGVAAAAIKESAPSDLVTDVITDAIHNITWYGRPIVSDYAMEHYSGVNQTTSTTAKPFVHLANAINNAAGVVGVEADVSPAVLQYASQQGFGYLADVIIPFMSGDRYTGEWSLKGAFKNVARELSGRFTLNPMASNDVQKEFEAAGTTLTRIMGDAGAGNPIGYLGYSLSDSERGYAVEEAERLMDDYNDLEKANKSYWAEISDVQEAEGLTDAEKAQQINAIREDMLAGEIEFLMEYESYENEYINCDPIATKLKNIFKPRPSLD